MKTVLLSAPYMIPNAQKFKQLLGYYDIDLIIAPVEERLEEDQLLPFAGKVDGVLCGDDKYTAGVLEQFAPRLKIISKWGTGIDSIDRAAAARLGIKVGNTPNAFTIPVADSVVGYMLSFARHLPWMDRLVKEGKWGKIPSVTLSECTVGVVGVGRIGKAVLRRLHAFGACLLGNDIVEIDPDFVYELRVEMTSLEDLLRRSDFVSLNCDLNPTSRHLINEKTLRLMKPNAVLINAARGPVVDEPALIRALQEGWIAGAALDVFEKEPLPSDSPLLKMDNVMLAGHNANSSPRAWERVHKNTLHNLLEGLGIPHDDLSQRWQEVMSS